MVSLTFAVDSPTVVCGKPNLLGLFRQAAGNEYLS